MKRDGTCAESGATVRPLPCQSPEPRWGEHPASNQSTLGLEGQDRALAQSLLPNREDCDRGHRGYDKSRQTALGCQLQPVAGWQSVVLRRARHDCSGAGGSSKPLRAQAGRTKARNKLSDGWDAHCVDSFVLASYAVGGPSTPEQTAVLYLVPLQFHRRQLHRLQPAKGGVRSPYGGTMSLGLKRGSWVRHPTWRLAYVGGTMNGRISLHAMHTGKRLTQGAKVDDCTVLTTAAWRTRKPI